MEVIVEELRLRPGLNARRARVKWYGPVRVFLKLEDRELLEQLTHLRRELQLSFPLADDAFLEQ